MSSSKRATQTITKTQPALERALPVFYTENANTHMEADAHGRTHTQKHAQTHIHT